MTTKCIVCGEGCGKKDSRSRLFCSHSCLTLETEGQTTSNADGTIKCWCCRKTFKAPEIVHPNGFTCDYCLKTHYASWPTYSNGIIYADN